MSLSCAHANNGDDDYQEEGSIRNGQALDLFDKYWFFGTPRNHKTSTKTMLRCLSDPCASKASGSSSHRRSHQEELSKDAKSPIGVDDDDEKLTPATCDEGKSLSDYYAEITKGKLGLPDPRGSNASERLPRQGIVRAPSLPPDIGRAEVFREEEPSIRSPRINMPRRQVSLNLSDMRPPRNSLKSSSMPRYRPNMYPNSNKSKKSLNDLEKEEVQGFKDLGFSFEDKDLNQNLVSVLPGLQEKSHENEERQDNSVQRPYLSEAWIAQSYAPPPIPIWNSKGSPEDMKAHIKNWARAVASNVR